MSLCVSENVVYNPLMAIRGRENDDQPDKPWDLEVPSHTQPDQDQRHRAIIRSIIHHLFAQSFTTYSSNHSP